MTYVLIRNGLMLKATDIKPDIMDEWLETDIPIENVDYVNGMLVSVDKTPNNETPIIKIPSSIPKWKGQVVLEQRGLLTQIETMIAQNRLMDIIYKNVTTFERDNTLIAGIATALSWDDAYVDALFIEANGVSAAL